MATKLIKQSYPIYETIVGDFIINNRDDKDKVTLLQESWQTNPSPSLWKPICKAIWKPICGAMEFKIKDIDILIEALQEFNREVKNSRKIFAGFPCGMETNLRSNTVETMQSNKESRKMSQETEDIIREVLLKKGKSDQEIDQLLNQAKAKENSILQVIDQCLSFAPVIDDVCKQATAKIKPSGRVDDGSYLPFEGKPIKSGDPIDMSFAGSPVNAPKPWTLVRAEDKFSTVNYKNNPSVTIKDANGIEHTFDRADYYSPRHPE